MPTQSTRKSVAVLLRQFTGFCAPVPSGVNCRTEAESLLAAQQVEAVIPSRSYRKQPRDYDRLRYRERNIVERFINKIKWYRRIFTRYEKLARRFMAFLHFASTLFWLEQNVNEP